MSQTDEARNCMSSKNRTMYHNVYVNNTKVKSYPFKIQAVIYCYMNGYVNEGGHDFDNGWYIFLDDKVKVVKE